MASAPSPAPSSAPTVVERVVVIGSGLAGHGVLRELRRLAPELALTLVTADDGHFYSKPALSTALAKGKTAETLVTTPIAKVAATLKLEAKTRCTVVAIDRAAQVVRTDTGDFAYDALVLALGADPVMPRLDGDAAGAALPVNTLDDYARFRRDLAEGARVLVLGAGLVGTEFANDLAVAGYVPVVVDMLDRPLAQLVPVGVGAVVREALAAAGVEWHFGRRVVAVDRAGAGADGGYVATLDNGTRIAADTLVSAVGLRPHVALARAAGLSVDAGISVDHHGRTSDPHIYAIGDCAEYPIGPAAYVAPIMGAARAIAPSILGTDTAMRFPVMSVQVKTTLLPLILLPPPRGTAGEWIADADDATGQRHLFRDASGRTAGYALTGARCAERIDLDRSIAAALEKAA